MHIIEYLREMLMMGKSKIRIKGEDANGRLMEVRMTHHMRKPIKLGTSINEITISIQPLILKNAYIAEGDNRIDNSSHGGLHRHIGNNIVYLSDRTMSGALLVSFGQEYNVLENQPFSN